ncbi:MAG: hypothetical protein Q4C70_12895, partial [Planctomycetia bacterium]|nr:hypothetical protein [Planctomycetia bacterium]
MSPVQIQESCHFWKKFTKIFVFSFFLTLSVNAFADNLILTAAALGENGKAETIHLVNATVTTTENPHESEAVEFDLILEDVSEPETDEESESVEVVDETEPKKEETKNVSETMTQEDAKVLAKNIADTISENIN